MTKYEFNGISTEQFNEQDKDTCFFSIYDETIIEKEPFTVYLDDKEVQLHLYIEDIDMGEFEDTTDHIIAIGVIPTFNSLSTKHQNDILEQFDVEDRDNINNIVLLSEIKSYGFNIILRSETVKLDDVDYKFNSAVAVRSAVSGLIGFELDRRVNAIGNTGWDFLSNYCEDTDILELALDR